MPRRLWGLLAGAVAVATIVMGAPAAVAATGLPNDPAAHGYVGLCDETGHNVVGGLTATHPFIWKAVSSITPPVGYQGKGQNATLTIFQPRPNTYPGDWSGTSLTAGSFYADKASPTAQATYADESLQDFIDVFPPMVDGLYVLRMTYGKADYGVYGQTYPTTTIQVVGNRWHVVSGGTVDCARAVATSSEAATHVASAKQLTPRRRAPAGQTTTGPAGSHDHPGPFSAPPSQAKPAGASSASTPPSGSAAAPGSSTAATAASSEPHHDSSSHGWVWFVVVPGLVILALAFVWWRTRTRARPPLAP